MMATNPSKSLPKVFVKDLNIERFLGIFSAHYCWPEDIPQKSWSDVMCGSSEWFTAKLWPKLADKLPLITADEKSVQQINELMFGLILKELDLLTFSQMQYFEAVLDLFNDEITIGINCWLKICFKFNWHMIYANQVVSHRNKHLSQLIQLVVEEIEKNEKQNLFTAEEISYFYSLVECICVQILANNVVNNSSADNQFLTDIRSKISSKLCQLNYDPFVRQLMTFNVLSQELIGFSLTLIHSECICNDAVQSQLRQIDELFTDDSKQLDIISQIPVNIKGKLREDMHFADECQKSLQLVNKQYFSINKNHLSSKSLEKFFKSIEDQTNLLLPLKRFHYLSNVLNDKQNPNYYQLVEILLNMADFETFGPLMSSLNGVDITSYDLTLKLATRLLQISSDPKTKNFLTALLIKSLKLSETIDLESRVNSLKINKICDPKTDSIKTLFNQMTKSDINSSLFEELTHELTVGIYLNPFSVYNLVLDLALEHNRAQTGLVAKLICEQLYCLSTFRLNSDESETFLLKFIVHILMERPSLQMVDDMTRLIDEIIKCPVIEGQEPTLKLDELFFYLLKYQCLMKPDVVWIKLKLIKNIIEISGDHSWNIVESKPVPTLMFLLQFIEYFWLNPNRKQLVIEILDLILDRKLTRNLTEDELTHMTELMAKRFDFNPGKASTHKIYLAYCEKRFPKAIGEVIDITHNIFHDQILCYATITPDFMWICNVYPEYQLFVDQTKIALNYILPALTTHEFYRLFRFLQMYYYNSIVVNQLRTAIFAIDRSIDKKYLIKELMNIVTNEVLIPMRSETMERPLSREDYEYTRMNLLVLFKSMATLDYQMLPNDMAIRLKEILTELAEMMVFEGIDAYGFYEEANLIPVAAQQVLQQAYGHGFPHRTDDIDLKPGLLPAGMSEQNRSALKYTVEQTVCQ